MKLIHKLLFTVGLFVSCATLAQAHAFLDHADPKVGGTVTASPSAVKIWFTEELDPSLCNIRVFDAAGNEIDKKDVKIDPAQKLLMSVSVPKLSAGTYKVVWNAVCMCGCNHHTNGTFTFSVARAF
jgi:methionine-rich copper-binding protein CopC